MSNEPDKIIYSMIRVSKRHGQKEVLERHFAFSFYGPRSACWGLNGAQVQPAEPLAVWTRPLTASASCTAPGYTIGYLEQEPLAGETRTVREVVEEGVRPSPYRQGV